MASSENPVLIGHRRRHLESLLLEATKYLPQQAGLSKQRLEYFDGLFARKAPVPKTEEEIIANDNARREAVLEIVSARVAAGHEPAEAQRKWESFIRMGQAGKPVLWQQHAYIVATLEERDDKEAVGSREGEDCTRMAADSTASIAKGKQWLNERKALRRLLNVTRESLERGFLEKQELERFERAFGTQDSGFSSEAIWNRRDATILLLRARMRAGLYEKVDEEGEWEGKTLPAADEMTMEELSEETGAAVGGVEENENETTGGASEPSYGREAAPSPDRMDSRPSSPLSRPRREYSPIPLSP